jgi:serine/threonine-protein kinase
VFRAEDVKHLRPVAVKVLHPEIAATAGPARFLREIETAARLNHPHILPLHDSGEADGLLYYVMPYVEGESLRDRLDRERQLPLEEAARIAREVGESLEYAHRQGVVHRDIKPENILISQGHALVADFGIAKLLEARAQRLTTSHASLGTPTYMSPEQLSGGEERIDGRADVYALGCVLYEMLAGQPPFTGATAESVACQHLSVKPRPVTELRPALPEAVARAIDHALEKAPADRPQSASDFVRELRAATDPAASKPHRVARAAVAVSAAAALLVLAVAGLWWARAHRAGGPSQQSIAVLPLKDLSADARQAYFADGMTDELITALAKISSLTVIAGSAVLTYRNSETR